MLPQYDLLDTLAILTGGSGQWPKVTSRSTSTSSSTTSCQYLPFPANSPIISFKLLLVPSSVLTRNDNFSEIFFVDFTEC